jgi:hypothetical protein
LPTGPYATFRIRLMPRTTLPSIWLRSPSGLMISPQSCATITRVTKAAERAEDGRPDEPVHQRAGRPARTRGLGVEATDDVSPRDFPTGADRPALARPSRPVGVRRLIGTAASRRRRCHQGWVDVQVRVAGAQRRASRAMMQSGTGMGIAAETRENVK